MSIKKHSEVIHKHNTTADNWAEFEAASVNQDKGENLPEWLKTNLSKHERRLVAVVNGEVYRPYYIVTHPRHDLPYLLDYESAAAIEKAWNTFRRQDSDRVQIEPVMFSSVNNRAIRK